MFIIPRADDTIHDDWGGEQVLGLGASSSNSITIDGAFVPDYNVVRFDFKDYLWSEHGGTPGYRLIGNPVYLGRTTTMFIAGHPVSPVGPPWAAPDGGSEERRVGKEGVST